MSIPPNKKSRFWSENQKNLNKTSPQEAFLDLQNNDLKGAPENFALKPSQKPVPESIRNALFGLTSNAETRKVAPAPVWDHINQNRSQSNDASPSHEEDLSKPELPKESLSSPSSPKEASKTSLKKNPSFKAYRDKFSIRVIPPRSIAPASIVPIQAESIDVAVDSEKDTGASGVLITPTSLLKSFNFENPDNREDVETRKFRLKRSLRRSLDAIYFLGNLIALTNHIKVRGSIRPVTYLQKQKTKKIIEERKRFFLPLMPTDTFKVFWNIILVILYAASAILTPFTVSFIEDGNKAFDLVNTIFNVLFGIDIVINFVSAFYSSKLGLVTDLKAIAFNYLRTWFLIDLLLVLPIDTFFQEFASGRGSSANRIKSLLRLLRIPRIYRILRVLRLFKMAKLFITNKTLNRMLKQFTLNIGLIKMVQVLGNLLFLNHIAACIWFLFARLSNFTPETWVVRSDLVDADPWTQYIASYYWAFQTLTTVGYGDINPETGSERAFAIMWMIVGVCMYSFAIANLSSILQNMDRRSALLRNKITAFNNFSIKVKLPDFLRQKVQRFFELNHKENIFYWIDPHDLLQDLPQNLRQSFLLYTYYPMINTIKLFKLDANFTVEIAPHLKLLKLKIFEILYREDDPSEEIYFISKGSVKFVTEDGDGIFSLVQGTYFGEMEVLDDVKRKSFCKAMEQTALFVCNKKIFLQAMKKYPKVEEHIKKSVQLRKEKFLNKMKEFQKDTQNQNKQQNDSISTVAGRKLLKSSDYFYAIVNQSNNRNKRLSNLSLRDPVALEELLTKRASESGPVTPKVGGPKSRIMELIRNMDKDKLEKTDREKEKDDKTNKSSTATSKFENWTAAINHHRSKSHKLLFQADNQLSQAKKDKTLIPIESQKRLSNIIQNKKAAENEGHSFDTSFQSSVFSQSPKAAADAKDDDKRSSSSSPPMPFGKIQNFDQFEQKRNSQNSNSLGSQDHQTSNEKCELINSLDKKYEQMYHIRDEIDHLFNTYEQKKEDVDRNFESIEQSQRELDEFAEKLFKFTKQ